MRQDIDTPKRRQAKLGFSPTVDAIRSSFAAVGIPAANADDISEAQAFAARLIGGKVVSPEKLAEVHETTGAGLFVVREDGELTGVFAMLLLTEEGRRSVIDDTFDSVDPAASHFVKPGEEPVAIYGWGIAATNHEAAQRILDGCQRLGRDAAPDLPVFARPVTPKGLRLMVERLQFKPVPGSTSGLVWAEPANARAAAAAA